MDDLFLELANNLEAVNEWQKMVLLAISTFVVSEDLTTIAAGILVSQDSLAFPTAFWGCFLGIYLGDGLLYLIGLVLGRPAIKLPVLRRLLPSHRVEECERWFQKNGIAVVIMSRFLPGTRLPTYFAAGVMRSKASYFMLAAGIATAVWTPLLMSAAWFFGDRLTLFFTRMGTHPWLVIPLSFAILISVFMVLSRLTNWRWRRRARSRLKRLIRWEFWPIIILYIPVFVQNIWLIIRYRRISLPFLCNPGLEYGGIIGESKTDVLAQFTQPHPHVPQFILLEPSKREQRIAAVSTWMSENGIEFPIVLKPDAGQRGYGVRLIRDHNEVVDYLNQVPIPTIAQAFAAGPYEFGVYYIRMPNQSKGCVTGITGKEFPRIVGDGHSTIEDLILRLGNAQGRVHIFLKRFADRIHQVLPNGEVLKLVNAGNHCQGTIFLDHSHLITPQLEAKIDQLAQSMDGLFICRMDIRAHDLEAFRAGDAFQIVEINGATAEPSHIYDPRYGALNAWRKLMAHWSMVWRIGSLNLKAGHKAPRLAGFLAAFHKYRRNTRYHLDAN